MLLTWKNVLINKLRNELCAGSIGCSSCSIVAKQRPCTNQTPSFLFPETDQSQSSYQNQKRPTLLHRLYRRRFREK